MTRALMLCGPLVGALVGSGIAIVLITWQDRRFIKKHNLEDFIEKGS